MRRIYLLLILCAGFISCGAQSLYPVFCDEERSKFGYISSTGKLVVPCTYESADQFSEGLGLVKMNSKYGFIDHTGKVVIPVIYDKANSFKNGYAWVSSGGYDFFIDKQLNKFEIDNVSKELVSEGLVIISINGRKGYVNIKNELMIPADYNYATPFSNGVAVVRRKKDYFFIDRQGKETPVSYQDVKHFSENLLAVKGGTESLWGFVNEKNEIVIDFLYDYVRNFSEGFAVVTKKRFAGNDQ